MKRFTWITTCALALTGTAVAQPAPPPDSKQPDPGTAPNDGSLPPVTSDDDPLPEVPGPEIPPGGVIEQAGRGGTVGYARVGVLELGGSAGIQSGGGLTDVTVAPTLGWFVADNMELSGILNLTYADTDSGSGTLMSLLVEPSYHVPFNRSTFGFVGVGMGVSYVDGPGAAFAVAPRLGANFMVGRSGLLTPSLAWQYNTHDTMDEGENGVLVQVSSSVRANVGYTVMW